MLFILFCSLRPPLLSSHMLSLLSSLSMLLLSLLSLSFSPSLPARRDVRARRLRWHPTRGRRERLAPGRRVGLLAAAPRPPLLQTLDGGRPRARGRERARAARPRGPHAARALPPPLGPSGRGRRDGAAGRAVFVGRCGMHGLGRAVNGSQSRTARAGRVETGARVVAVAAGKHHTLCIDTAGAILSCGNGVGGRLGIVDANGDARAACPSQSG